MQIPEDEIYPKSFAAIMEKEQPLGKTFVKMTEAITLSHAVLQVAKTWTAKVADECHSSVMVVIS